MKSLNLKALIMLTSATLVMSIIVFTAVNAVGVKQMDFASLVMENMLYYGIAVVLVPFVASFGVDEREIEFSIGIWMITVGALGGPILLGDDLIIYLLCYVFFNTWYIVYQTIDWSGCVIFCHNMEEVNRVVYYTDDIAVNEILNGVRKVAWTFGGCLLCISILIIKTAVGLLETLASETLAHFEPEEY